MTLYVLTAATESTRGLPEFDITANRYGADPFYLGLGETWGGLTDKLKLVYKWLMEEPIAEPQLKPDDLLLFADGYDCLFVRNLSDIEHTFAGFGHEFVMSAETNCAPDADRAPRYPPSPTRHRFLNAGCWMATAHAARRLLEDLSVWRLPSCLNDQQVIADWWLDHQDRIRLDYSGELFHSCWEASADLDYGEQVTNRYTGARPYVVHGNGGSNLQPTRDWLLKMGIPLDRSG